MDQQHLPGHEPAGVGAGFYWLEEICHQNGKLDKKYGNI
jgi:hypothetical protein